MDKVIDLTYKYREHMSSIDWLDLNKSLMDIHSKKIIEAEYKTMSIKSSVELSTEGDGSATILHNFPIPVQMENDNIIIGKQEFIKCLGFIIDTYSESINDVLESYDISLNNHKISSSI